MTPLITVRIRGLGARQTRTQTPWVVLARHALLDAPLAGSMIAAVRFRNLLVHGYARVDDERVVAHLDGLGDLDAFVARLAGLLEA